MVASDYAGGTSSATWSDALGIHDTNSVGTQLYFGANGTVPGTPNSLLLPFTPQSGYIYTLTAVVTWTGNPGSWIGLGFAQNDSANVPYGYGRFSDSVNGGPNGYDWIILTESSANVQWFAGPHGTGQQLSQNGFFMANGASETLSIQVELDTTGIRWRVSSYVNGIQVATNYTYATNPTIGAVGITETSLGSPGAVQWNNIMLTAVAVPITNNTYWVASAAVGTGDVSSSANAASYLDSSFWSGIQSRLQVTNININLTDGNYNAGTLNLKDMGDPLHQLILQAVNTYGPVFSPITNNIIGITGSQNIKFEGIKFTGTCSSWGVICQPDYLNACRNLEFSYCQFINLTNAYYGAIGLVNGIRDILVDNCTFSNLTDNNGNHQHMIYASHDIVGLVVINCLFQDCLADYIRFRDNSEYCAVENCTFISTMSSSAWPFISAELYNDTNSDAAGDEFFGNYFQVSSNSFTYNVSGGPGPYSALHFSDTGYSPYSYHCDLTSSEATQLSTSTSNFQRSFLQTNMGIIAFSLKMFGNTYNSRVTYHMDYAYNTGNSPGNGWSGTIKLDNMSGCQRRADGYHSGAAQWRFRPAGTDVNTADLQHAQ
jgi:hypothetical protein